jgi:hypothetical protein
MAAAYSMDLRERVINDVDAVLSSKELGERYHVSRAWVDALKPNRCARMWRSRTLMVCAGRSMPMTSVFVCTSILNRSRNISGRGDQQRALVGNDVADVVRQSAVREGPRRARDRRPRSPLTHQGVGVERRTTCLRPHRRQSGYDEMGWGRASVVASGQRQSSSALQSKPDRRVFSIDQTPSQLNR